MKCSRCRDLERALLAKRNELNQALESSFHRVNVRFAAFQAVELERARTELEEHLAVCAHKEAVAMSVLPGVMRQGVPVGVISKSHPNLRK